MADVYVVVESYDSSTDPSVEVFAGLKSARERFERIVEERLGLGYEIVFSRDYAEDSSIRDFEFLGNETGGVRLAVRKVGVIGA